MGLSMKTTIFWGSPMVVETRMVRYDFPWWRFVTDTKAEEEGDERTGRLTCGLCLRNAGRIPLCTIPSMNGYLMIFNS